MRLPTRIAGLIVALASLGAGLVLAAPAGAGLESGLCHSDTARGYVSTTFPFGGCFDGKTLYVHNQTSVPARLVRGGSASLPAPKMTNYAVAVMIFRDIDDDGDLILPGDILAVPIGSGSAQIGLQSYDHAGYYYLAGVIADLLPGPAGTVVGGYQALAGVVREVNDDLIKYRGCLNGKNWIEQNLCKLTLTRDVGFALLRPGLTSVPSIAQVLLAGETFGKWVSANSAVINSGTIRFAATPAPAAPAPSSPGSHPPTSSGSPSPPSPAPSRPSTSSAPSASPAPAPGAPTYSEQETPNHPVNTFQNYHSAGGQGPAIGSGQVVQVSCKVYDPNIGSVNPDGYWYRIAGSPWNNGYYSPANTFLNGDPPHGPYSHNTDFAVPNC
jgi:hypothetical protein